jgi:hypothetical protein
MQDSMSTLNIRETVLLAYGIWYLSQKEGSLMIRPIVGKPIKTTSSDDDIPAIRKITGCGPIRPGIH